MFPRRPRSLLLLGAGLAALASAGPAQDAGRDVVKLKNGNQLEGLILEEGAKSLSIRIGPGQEIEIPKSVIATYTRVSEAPGNDERPANRWHQRHAWFRLKDADGNLVGKLAIHVRPDDDGNLRLEQQWTFVERDTRTFLSRIETVDANLRPLRFQYRENLRPRNGENVLRERLLRGTVRNGKLELQEVLPGGRRERSIPFPPGNHFPMLVRELLRRGEAKGAHSFSASVFDPVEGVFELRRYNLADGVPAPAAAGTPGRAGLARLIESESSGRIRREWISPDGRILLVEVNGVHLVAEPVSEATAAALRAFDKEKALPAWRTFAGLHLWLPRATWSFGPELVRGKLLQLRSSLPESDVKAWFLPEPAGGTTLQMVAQNFLQRWRLDEPWFREKSQDLVELSGRSCIRIDGGGKSAQGRLRRGRAYVLDAPSGYLVLSAQGPARTWGYLDLETREIIAGLRTTRTETVASQGK